MWREGDLFFLFHGRAIYRKMKRRGGARIRGEPNAESSSSDKIQASLPPSAVCAVKEFVVVNVRCASCAQPIPPSAPSENILHSVMRIPDTILCGRCRWVARRDSYFCCGYCTRADASVRMFAVIRECGPAKGVKRAVFCCSRCLRRRSDPAIDALSGVTIDMFLLLKRSGVSPRDDDDARLSELLRSAARIVFGEGGGDPGHASGGRRPRTVSALLRSPSCECYNRYLKYMAAEQWFRKK